MQKIFGHNNNQVTIESVIFEVKQTVSKMEDIFINFDEKIYELFGEIIDSKINEDDEKNNKVRFVSQKVFLSLMKIGIPLENAYKIVICVYNNIVINEKNGLYDNRILSTHEIRKIVAYEILHCDLDGISLKTLEEWGDKYVRRYGHNSKRTKIYYKDSLHEEDLSYNFIKNTLLKDITNEVGIKKYTYSGEIKKSQLKSMSEDIIDFIGNCNLYRIRYDILKSLVYEMALQPPHPWLVTDESAEIIRKYDIDTAKKHYLKIKENIDNKDYSSRYYTICEILHHTASSILAGYKEILGCKDLDAFTNLYKIVSKMYNDEKDLILEYNIVELPSDLKYIGINFCDFYSLLNKIHLNIVSRNREINVTKIFLQNILDLYDIAVALYEKTNKQKMKDFLFSSWDDFSKDERISLINLFFAVIDYNRINKICVEYGNSFWFNASTNGRHGYFVVCLEKMNFEKLNNYFNQLKIQKILESVLFVVEDNEHKKNFEKEIIKIDSSKVIIEYLYKKDLQRIFNSTNKLKELDLVLKEKLFD